MKSVATGCKEEDVDEQSGYWDSFSAGDIYMEDSGWRKDYEAEEQARARRKREKYKVGSTKLLADGSS